MEVTDTELAILEILWSRKAPVLIATIAEVLYGRRTASEHATVQSLLTRLEAKGCVRRERAGRAHVYTAAVQRGELIDYQLRALAEKLCDGSLTPLLTHLIHGRALKATERRELRELLGELEAGRAAAPSGGGKPSTRKPKPPPSRP